MTRKEKREEFLKLESAIKDMKMKVWVKGQAKSDDPFLEGTFERIEGDILHFKWVCMADGTWNDTYKMDVGQFQWMVYDCFLPKPPQYETEVKPDGSVEMSITWDIVLPPIPTADELKKIIAKEVKSGYDAGRLLHGESVEHDKNACAALQEYEYAWQYPFRVGPGPNMNTIARKYNTTIEAMKQHRDCLPDHLKDKGKQ